MCWRMLLTTHWRNSNLHAGDIINHELDVLLTTRCGHCNLRAMDIVTDGLGILLLTRLGYRYQGDGDNIISLHTVIFALEILLLPF